MKLLWERLERWVTANTGQSLALRPGASPQAIAALEKAGGMALPDDLRASLLAHNGQDDDAEPVRFPGCGFFGSVESILSPWTDLAELEEEYGGPSGEYEDGDRIDNIVFCARRIPIAGAPHWDQDNTYLDFVPGPKGNAGQVIQLVTECDFVVLAPDLRTYFERLAKTLESGLLVWSKDVDELVPAKGEWGQHPAEWLVKRWRKQSWTS